MSRSSGEMKFDSGSCMLKPVYFAFVKTMLEFFFLQTTHFVKSRAHSPRPMSKIIAMIALRRAILMKANPVVSLHANLLLSGRAFSRKKDPCYPGVPGPPIPRLLVIFFFRFSFSIRPTYPTSGNAFDAKRKEIKERLSSTRGYVV